MFLVSKQRSEEAPEACGVFQDLPQQVSELPRLDRCEDDAFFRQKLDDLSDG
jgi:hypothetical protein